MQVYSICLVNNLTREEEVLEGLECPEGFEPEDYFIGPSGTVWDNYDPEKWTAELFGPDDEQAKPANEPSLFGTLVSALDVGKVCGRTCPSCGRDNSEYGDICSADDCPGVMALKSAGQDAKEVNRLAAVAREVNSLPMRLAIRENLDGPPKGTLTVICLPDGPEVCAVRSGRPHIKAALAAPIMEEMVRLYNQKHNV